MGLEYDTDFDIYNHLLQKIIQDINFVSNEDLILTIFSVGKVQSFLSKSASRSKPIEMEGDQELVSVLKKKIYDEDKAGNSTLDNEEKTESKAPNGFDPEKSEIILEQCNTLLGLISEKLETRLTKLETSQMSKIMDILTTTPLQLDKLVQSIESEIDLRCKSNGSKSSVTEYTGDNLNRLLKHTEECSVDAAATSTKLKMIWENRLKTDQDINDDIDNDISDLIEDLSRQISRTAATSCKASNRLKKLNALTSADAENLLET